MGEASKRNPKSKCGWACTVMNGLMFYGGKVDKSSLRFVQEVY